MLFFLKKMSIKVARRVFLFSFAAEITQQKMDSKVKKDLIFGLIWFAGMLIGHYANRFTPVMVSSCIFAWYCCIEFNMPFKFRLQLLVWTLAIVVLTIIDLPYIFGK